jgi:hypothetical protein
MCHCSVNMLHRKVTLLQVQMLYTLLCVLIYGIAFYQR